MFLFDIYEGEWLAIVGHNGSGKSTIAKLLNGLQFPEAGKITVCGIQLNEETVWDIRKKLGWYFKILIISLLERLYKMMWLLV